VFPDEATSRERLSVVVAVKREIVSGVNKFTFSLPYYLVRKSFSKLTGRRTNEVWSESLFARLVSPIVLPDGNLLMWSWEVDAFWLKELVKEIYEDRVYERFFRVEEGDIVVDVGANAGIFTLKASKRTGHRGKVFSFEPEAKNYRRLCRNIRINRRSNVIPINAAVSDIDGTADFYVKDVSLQHTLLPETTMTFDTHTVKTVRVQTRAISSVLEEFGLNHIDFLKVDAEGAELEVLKGSIALLSSKRIRKLSVATYHSKTETEIIGNFLQNFGYRVRVFRNEGLGHFQLEHLYGSLVEDDLAEKSVHS